MPNITFNCPMCGMKLTVDGSGAGLQVNCLGCNETVAVPIPQPQTTLSEPIVPVPTAVPQSHSSQHKSRQILVRSALAENTNVLGGFWIRFGAYAVDCAVLLIPCLLIAFLFRAVASRENPQVVYVGEFMLTTLVWWVYCAAFVSSKWQATLGKKVCGLKVVDYDDGRLTFGRATGRFFASALSALSVGIGFFMIAWEPRKQGVHDIITKSLVVRDGTKRKEAITSNFLPSRYSAASSNLLFVVGAIAVLLTFSFVPQTEGEREYQEKANQASKSWDRAAHIEFLMSDLARLRGERYVMDRTLLDLAEADLIKYREKINEIATKRRFKMTLCLLTGCSSLLSGLLIIRTVKTMCGGKEWRES